MIRACCLWGKARQLEEPSEFAPQVQQLRLQQVREQVQPWEQQPFSLRVWLQL
jgi:hypothetical protein